MNIIKRISYREMGSKIIQFFSVSQSELKIKEKERRNISSRNICTTINYYIKNNLPNYFYYLKGIITDLTYELNKI